MTTSVMHGWGLEVDRGPDWIIVRLNPPERAERASTLAEDLWSVVQQHMVHRVVLELHDVDQIGPQLAHQLVVLHEQLLASGGVMRICGLSPEGLAELDHHCVDLDGDQRFPHYANRDEAIRGEAPHQPR